MRRELLVPKLGLTMTEGVLVEWMVQPGERFKVDQGLFVIESEKAANEVGAEGEGVLLEIAAQAGQTLACGTVIGYWDDGQAAEMGATVADGPATASVEPAGSAVVAGAPQPPAVLPALIPAPPGQARIPVTPLARRLAAQQGVDLNVVLGSGPRGRIRARDVMAHGGAQAGMATVNEAVADKVSAAPAAAVLAASGASPTRVGAPSVQGMVGAGVLRAPTSLERTIAQRLTAAKQQVPHFYLSLEAEMSAVLSLRRQLNADPSSPRLTLNHFVLAAVGRALEAAPQINRIWTDDGILSLEHSDVGMAVDTEKGLLVPVLRAVGRQSLGGIARQSGELIGRAQAGRLRGADMLGGAITVSNAGMHNVTYMTSIINPGQSMILGVGSIREVFRPDEQGQPAIHREMGMVLSADHRVLDGVSALSFFKHVVQGLAQPLNLLVG